uniref:Neur_chan_memb domain-containing protein n=1 Tax=Angiostrongylus cantonensis TaxID=6313 RepID=A0A0K0D112_ANGCA
MLNEMLGTTTHLVSEQVCALTFGSWTFKKDEVQISYLLGKRQVELNDYSFSGIWDVMEVPGLLIENRSKISYQIRIRRKTLFYTVILIMPTVLMAFLSMMVFYLPCEASEKITLAISILLALVVFLLLVSKILPPTSSTIPLMAKYLLLTFVMNMITIMVGHFRKQIFIPILLVKQPLLTFQVTVVIINVYFRGPATHTMPNWHLPVLLMMRRPESTERELKRTREKKMERKIARGILHGLSSVKSDGSAIEYITNHLTRDNNYKRQCDEWKYVSMVLDRLLLYVFFAATTGGTVGVLFSAPNVFEYVDQAGVIENLKRAAVAQQHNPGL